ncbi:right-handed parallel beta-helix repeat-containing protein [Rhizohabitans arisaemae]|uniref:right-handed parallel beta-helix repeat-containing protein n=1 Tax=Rhizohabitans arisaemae TaxID=2720610 RepID=UPI0024B179C3|nr:right-handed parallel beta-helix repeat-containing protein [Rhizohabitans arisaemae]
MTRRPRLLLAAVLLVALTGCQSEPPPEADEFPPVPSIKPRKEAGGKLPDKWPNSRNTGVPKGVQLKRIKSMVIDKDGTVIDGAFLYGDIVVAANNVTIRRTKILNPGDYWAVIQREGFEGLTVEDTEISGTGKRRLSVGIMNKGGMMTVRRTDIHTMQAAVNTQEGVIEDNYFHDPVFFEGDHTDLIWARGGQPQGRQLIIRHNTVLNSLNQTAAIALFQFDGVTHNTIMENNLLGGGSYALYGGGGKYGVSYNVKIINNTFSRRIYPKGGGWGHTSRWDAKGKGNEWRGNVWEDTGEPVPEP